MQVSKSEYALLEILWKENPLTVGQVIERAQSESDWHENTVKTLLTRLTKKEAVSRTKDGKRYFYSPIISKEVLVLEESEGFLSRFFGGSMAPLVAHFARNKKLSEEDIKEIQKILNSMGDKDND